METRQNCQNLLQWYQLALENKDIHECTIMDLRSVDVKTLFIEDNALKFIKGYFSSYNISNSKNDPSKKIWKSIEKITEFRAKHTVAAFLLGITVKEKLSFDIRDWIRMYNSHSSEQSFGFFWSTVCLLHDTGYYWERSSKKFLEDYINLDTFCEKNEITYNLLDSVDTKLSALIKDYYKYSIYERHKLDHGIIGGILIYDALMNLYEVSKDCNNRALCGMQIRNNFPTFALKIAGTVALHNMWRANKNNVQLYRKYNLLALVPNENSEELVYYSDDRLLFLLGLIDTIDPIKAFCNTEGGHKSIDLERVLNNIEISFVNQKEKRITITGKDISFKDYIKTVKGLEAWLGVNVHIDKNDIIIITMLKRTNIIKNIA